MKSKALSVFATWARENKKVAFVVALGILGMVLLFVSGLESTDKPKENEPDVSAQRTYEQEIEEKLRQLVESIDGAGRAEIMIVFESSEESVFARDSSEDVETSQKDNSRKTEDKYVIVENDGRENGLLTKAVYPKVRGVAVCCDGASDSVIRQRIIETVSALFDINSTNISVVRRAG